MKEFLRQLPVFAGIDDTVLLQDSAPANPLRMFSAWLRDAAEAGEPEPHAMTLSTVDPDGAPDARILILKDLTDDAFVFATSGDSPKARQLKANPAAAVTFHWPVLGRQVRARGAVSAGPERASADDYLARSASARALARIGRQSEPLASREELRRAHRDAVDRINAEPASVALGWTQYALRPVAVEFWQASPSRLHTRLLYERRGLQWSRRALWP